jgi:hypothetical protein
MTVSAMVGVVDFVAAWALTTTHRVPLRSALRMGVQPMGTGALSDGDAFRRTRPPREKWSFFI